MRLSIVIPTCGRASLAGTLASVRAQGLREGDEVILVTDGAQPAAHAAWRQSGLRCRFVESHRTNDWGGTQRNLGMGLAGGDYLLFMDDDDWYTPRAFETVRAALAESPGRPHLFRMAYAGSGRLLWARPEVAVGNVSTQMVCFPNDLRRLARWGGAYTADHDFIRDTLALYPPAAAVWREDVIALIGPEGRQPTPPPASAPPCPHRSAEAVGVRACGH